MKNSLVFQVVSSLNKVERNEARRFLQSPFFNTREDLVGLFDYLCATESPDRVAAWEVSAEGADYDDQAFRLRQSYLLRLLEDYLGWKEMAEQAPASLMLYALAAYRKRGLEKAFLKKTKQVRQHLAGNGFQDIGFHRQHYQLSWEAYQYEFVKDPTRISMLSGLRRRSALVYLSGQLRLVCLQKAHLLVYQGGGDEREDEIIAMAQRAEYCEEPVVAVYLACYRMLDRPERDASFVAFGDLLSAYGVYFPAEELHALYILAINYCIRRLNAGDLHYFEKVYGLYQEALDREVLLESGVLSRFTYHNVVASGLHVGDLEWVRRFIHEYRHRLEKPYRESSYSFNLARLEFASRNFSYVLDLLQKANYRDVLLNLAAKTLLLKTYYALGNLDLLQSHLDAMRNYIHRKRVIGYHRNNYLNIVRYTEKMLRLNPNAPADRQELMRQVEQEELLSEKPFLLKALSEMRR